MNRPIRAITGGERGKVPIVKETPFKFILFDKFYLTAFSWTVAAYVSWVEGRKCTLFKTYALEAHEFTQILVRFLCLHMYSMYKDQETRKL